jgi:hypothetical protein
VGRFTAALGDGTRVVCSGADPARDQGAPEGLRPLFALRWERNWRGVPALTWESFQCDTRTGGQEEGLIRVPGDSGEISVWIAVGVLMY